MSKRLDLVIRQNYDRIVKIQEDYGQIFFDFRNKICSTNFKDQSDCINAFKVKCFDLSKRLQEESDLRLKLIDLKNQDMSWKNCLEFKFNIGFWCDAQSKAKEMCYPFFCWNNIVYASNIDYMLDVGCEEDLMKGNSNE